MTYAGGQAGPGTYSRWPVPSDQVPRYAGPRADPVGFVLLLIAGVFGLGQYLVAGYPVGQSQPVGGAVLSGKQLLESLSVYTRDATATANVTRIAVVVTTVGGGALILLAIATLLPMTHRPLGAVALVVSLAGVASSVWLLAQAAKVLGSPAAALLSADHLGWYLTAAFALVGVFGSIKALGS
jgi:hypothetical protein